jgi:hypothetical protein
VGDIDEEYEANRFLRLINEDEDDLLEKEVQLRALQREDELFKVFRSEIAKLSENIQIAKMAV